MNALHDFLFGGSTLSAKAGTLVGNLARLGISSFIIFAAMVFFVSIN